MQSADISALEAMCDLTAMKTHAAEDSGACLCRRMLILGPCCADVWCGGVLDYLGREGASGIKLESEAQRKETRLGERNSVDQEKEKEKKKKNNRKTRRQEEANVAAKCSAMLLMLLLLLLCCAIHSPTSGYGCERRSSILVALWPRSNKTCRTSFWTGRVDET